MRTRDVADNISKPLIPLSRSGFSGETPGNRQFDFWSFFVYSRFTEETFS